MGIWSLGYGWNWWEVCPFKKITVFIGLDVDVDVDVDVIVDVIVEFIDHDDDGDDDGDDDEEEEDTDDIPNRGQTSTGDMSCNIMSLLS